MLKSIDSPVDLTPTLRDSSSLISSLKEIYSAFSSQLNQAFKEGVSVDSLMRARADHVDNLLQSVWRYFGLDQQDVSLIAVGGYGRGELHPHSDIDLLLLLPDGASPSAELEQFLTLLWDIRLDIGHSVRTLSECIALAREDISVITSLMESRVLIGDTANYQLLLERTGPEYMWDAKRFYGAKWEEQITRHEKFGDTEYSLEPNLKAGPGGLRDIQILGWLGLRQFGTSDVNELERLGVLTPEEADLIQRGRRYLWKTRWELHLLAGREEDRLLFDHQRLLAATNGLVDNDKQMAVEQYMQRYYTWSMALSSMNELVMQAFEEFIWDTFASAVPQAFNERFQIRDRHLEPIDPKLFQRNPSAILESFVILAEEPNIIGATISCTRAILEARNLINQRFRDDPHNKILFIRLLNAPHKIASQLRRMNQQGILQRYLPIWAPLVGKMQHDLFHIYTVDAHTIQVVNNLRLMTYEDAGEEKYPLAAAVIRQLPELDLLYVAGLFHDIGKGRGGDHSELGAIDAREFCQNHGYDEKDTALVEWLVRNHLLMSSTSQRKDITDPDVITEFALSMGNVNYLNYLFVLTVADINATNPNLWTSWRASLLRQLYTETRRALRRGLEKQANREEWINSTRRMAMFMLHQRHYNDAQIEAAWDNPGDDYFLREDAKDIAWHTEAIINNNRDPLVLIKGTDTRKHEGATQIFIYTKDTERLFARTTTLLAQLGLSVQDARIYSNSKGYSLDTYIVLNADDEPLENSEAVYGHVRRAISDGLRDPQLLRNAHKRRIPRKLKHFSYPAQVRYEQDPLKDQTIIEVVAPDRAGLLATVATTFNDFDIDLLAAKVSTFGERVEDVFFIADHNGGAIHDNTLLTTLCQTLATKLDETLSNEP